MSVKKIDKTHFKLVASLCFNSKIVLAKNLGM